MHFQNKLTNLQSREGLVTENFQTANILLSTHLYILKRCLKFLRERMSRSRNPWIDCPVFYHCTKSVHFFFSLAFALHDHSSIRYERCGPPQVVNVSIQFLLDCCILWPRCFSLLVVSFTSLEDVLCSLVLFSPGTYWGWHQFIIPAL